MFCQALITSPILRKLRKFYQARAKFMPDLIPTWFKSMNIRARIRKLEKTFNIGGFCLCYGKVEYPCILDNSAKEYRVIPLPDVCDKCGKVIDKSALKMDFGEWERIAEQRVQQAAETLAMFED